MGDVILANIITSNGVIHGVDKILAPYALGTTVTTDGLDDSFSILGAALSATGLDTALDGNGSFTLFAPTDEAFLKVFTSEELAELLADDADMEADLAALAEILSYHVVPTQVLSTDLIEGLNPAPTLTGTNLYVTLEGTAASVQGVEISTTDILASNGVIHVTEGILFPYGVGSTIITNGLNESFEILGAALSAANLVDTLDAAASYTLFAPTDAAFLKAFTPEQLEELLADDADKEADIAALTGILLYHVLDTKILSTDLALGTNSVQALSEQQLDVVVGAAGVTAQNANVFEFDILAGNGVIHVVDEVLAP